MKGKGLATFKESEFGIGVKYGYPDYLGNDYSIIDFILPKGKSLEEIKELSLDKLTKKTSAITRKKQSYNNITRIGFETTVHVEKLGSEDMKRWLNGSYDAEECPKLEKVLRRFKNFLYNINEDEFKQYKNQVNKELEILNKNNSPRHYYLYEAENKEK